MAGVYGNKAESCRKCGGPVATSRSARLGGKMALVNGRSLLNSSAKFTSRDVL